MRYLASMTNNPYVKCKNCGKWYRRQVEEQVCDEDNDVVVYYCYCPYCGEEYQWKECYWSGVMVERNIDKDFIRDWEG